MENLKDKLKEITFWGVIGKLGEWGTAFLVFWLVILPKVEDSQDARIEKFHEDDNSKIKFRMLMSDEFDIPSDRIHIFLKDENDKFHELEGDFYSVFEWIKDEKETVHPRLIYENDSEYWIDKNGKKHEVHRAEDGRGSYFFRGKWHLIFW